MKIYRGNTTIADVYLRDSSYVNEEINGEFISFLNFDSRNPVNLTINDTVECFGDKFYIRYKESVEKEETSLGFSYQVKFYHFSYKMYEVAFFLYDTPEFKKNTSKYTGTAHDVLQLLVKSMNRIYPGWTVGEYPETKSMTFNFQNKKCGEVKDELLRTYEGYEFWVSGMTMNFGKREYASNGLVLSQGNGLVNLAVEAVDDTPPITRLYAYGGDTNVTADKGDYLQLPDGELYIEKNIDKYGIIEHVEQFEDIFPKGEFKVTAKIDDSTLQSSDIDFNLTDQLIEDVEVVVTFQDGGLAGYDLNIVKGSWINETKQFELLQNEDETALKVPGDITFNVGDTFILTSLKMPDSYYESASEELLVRAQQWLDQKCENRIQVRGACDELDFAERDIHIACGQMVGIYNQKLEINREIRAVKVKRYLENNDEEAFRYDITFSDFLQGNAWSKVVQEVKETPKRIEQGVRSSIEYTRRSYKNSEEHLTLIEQAVQGFDQGISPSWINSMAGLFGKDTLQFKFVDSKTNPQAVDSGIRYDNDTKQMTAPSGIIQHQTIGIMSLSPTHASAEHRYWDLPEYESARLDDTEARYMYARCEKDGDNGVFLLSKTPFDFETEDYYYLLIGTLSTEYDGIRSYVESYGFTEILPGRITLWKIVDPDGYQFWDMLNRAFRIGNENNHLAFNVDGQGRLILKGVMTQSPSGDLSTIGVWRGDYSGTTQYYVGDEFYYNGSTYRCVVQPPDSGVSPTNTTYFKVSAAKGDPGDPGEPGSTGSTGPGIVFRGDYADLQDKGETVFYNNSIRRDVVYRNSTYYVYNGTNGQNNTTWVASRWQTFGAQFSSVATNLLLAESANIAGWIFRNERLESQSGGAFLDGRTGSVRIKGDFRTGDTGEDRFVMSGNTLLFYDTNNEILLDVRLNSGQPQFFIRHSSGQGHIYLKPEGIEVRDPQTGKTFSYSWSNGRANFGFSNISDWATSAYGGYMWRDSNGFLRVG